MGHKVLRDHANVFCQMFVGWRMQSDLSTFTSLPDGTMTVDVLVGSCVHNTHGPINTHIAGEIAAWFRHQLAECGIPEADIQGAQLQVRFTKSIPPPGRKRGVEFHWECSSEIKSVDRAYHGKLTESHTWMPARSPKKRREFDLSLVSQSYRPSLQDEFALKLIQPRWGRKTISWDG